MIELGVNVIVLRIKNNTLGDVADISVMGKTLENWAALCVDAPHKAIEASPVIDLADKIKAAADRTKPVTVLLYCDTPLVTQKTVSRAIEQLKANNADSVKLPRGCVYRTEFLFNVQSVYMRETGGSGEFEPVTDESILDAVFNEYLKAEAEFCDECDCGECDCDECGHEHHHHDDCGCGECDCEHHKPDKK